MRNNNGWEVASATGSQIDKGLIVGVISAASLIFLGIVSSGKILNYLDLGGFLLVFGGTIAATLIHFSLDDLRYAWNATQRAAQTSISDPMGRIRELSRMAKIVRQDGLLALEKESIRLRDPYFKLALEIAVDGRPQGDIKRILETEIFASNERDSRAVQVLQTMGTYAPALGLIGTLMGLIQMLGTLNDPATVGPAMSLALVATLYGAVLANLCFLPLAGKIRRRSEEDLLVKTITLEGAMSIAKQESPISLEQRLQGFLPLVGNGER